MMRVREAGAVAALIAVALAAGCASAPTAPPPAGTAGGVPGFDTRTYPGDATMRAWREASPYRWVGYYLTAPCHPRSTWVGRRAALADMGWGFAVLYTGEQDWSAIANPPQGPGAGTPGAPVRCTAANLSAERGEADGREAVAGAAAEGFGAGTTLYLNVERVDRVSPALEAYVRSWVGAVAASGTARPGLYVHAHNAAQLFATARGETERLGADAPRLWVARSGGFSLNARPAGSGVAEANIWQGLFDVRETWGGASATIDANVADRPSPSS